MYGTGTMASGAAGSGTLAVTGVAVGSTILAAIGVLFLIVALYAFFKPHKGRP